jgi:D-glycero-D-manno-heptose 1,7-bisphosphate phosphatase
MNKAAFLDRDGVINRKAPGDGYITRWEEMEFLPDVAQTIALLNRAGFRVIVVTNQRCVAKGLVTMREVDWIHRRMCDVLADAGAIVDAVYYCPHELEPPCSCRKPQPGLLLKAGREHGIALNESWMIGDSDADIDAGRNAGCRTARLLSSQTADRNADVAGALFIDVVREILDWERRSGRKQGKGASSVSTLERECEPDNEIESW